MLLRHCMDSSFIVVLNLKSISFNYFYNNVYILSVYLFKTKEKKLDTHTILETSVYKTDPELFSFLQIPVTFFFHYAFAVTIF